MVAVLHRSLASPPTSPSDPDPDLQCKPPPIRQSKVSNMNSNGSERKLTPEAPEVLRSRSRDPPIGLGAYLQNFEEPRVA